MKAEHNFNKKQSQMKDTQECADESAQVKVLLKVVEEKLSSIDHGKELTCEKYSVFGP